MSRKKPKQTPKRVLRLPDLDFAKSAVLNTLRSPESKRSYRFAIDDFVAWYCSEPRLAFNKTVVLRYRLELESRRLSSSTINLRLAAVRRLAYEAADTGLLSPELAAGIRRVKGAKRVGVRLGNWLSAEQVKELLRSPNLDTMKGKRDRAIIAVLAGCGLRRSEVAQLAVSDIQKRDDRWVIVDLYGKGGHIRTVPVPDWVKSCGRLLDDGGAGDVRPDLPLREQDRFRLGRRYHREGDLVRREGVCLESSARQPCASRSAAHMRPSVPRCGRRTGADPVPPRARKRADDREVPRLQAEAAHRGQ